MAIERKTFREVFDEDLVAGILKLRYKINVRGSVYNIGAAFSASEGLGGVDFHQFRYFDVALEKEPEPSDAYVIKGFYNQKS